MEAHSLLHIVSGFKPDSDGMGDFAKLLGDGLWRKKQIPSHFAVYRRPKSPANAEELLPHSLSYPEQANTESFLDHIYKLLQDRPFKKVLLHYGPYAYASDGKPSEFARRMRELAGKVDLLVFFHETYAPGKPWRRAFWTRPGQENAVREIASSVKVAFTSTALFMQRVRHLGSPALDLQQIRIFSNVGEPEQIALLSRRARQLVIFGRLHNRMHLYTTHLRDLENICRRLSIETIADAGAGAIPPELKRIANADIRRYGFLDQEGISNLLANSIAGMIGYGPDFWEKSGVLAAYEAHGMIPILAPLASTKNLVQGNLPFVLSRDLSPVENAEGIISIEALQSFADKTHRFYTENQSLKRCVEVIAPYLDSLSEADSL